MLSTAQQMLQDSRSKIELIRLQIIKVTQAGGGGGISGDGEGDPAGHGGQSLSGDSYEPPGGRPAKIMREHLFCLM